MVKRTTGFVKLSKSLRSNQTLWEQKLWYYLRAGRFCSLKFKRQVVVENYIVDFCCNQRKLIIELDGSQHLFSEKDKVRDLFFKSLGYRVLRFWNNEIEYNIERVLDKIYKEINAKEKQFQTGTEKND